jgi:CBS domain-containing protein
LEKFSDLRNIIIHEQFKPNYIIAEPHTEIVEAIEKIAETFEAPPKLIPRYKRDVKTFKSTDSLAQVLNLIKEENLSQFPIYDDNSCFLGLLTERCIAHWLALNASEDLISLEETTVGDVLSYDETEGRNVTFLKRRDTVYDAYNKFIGDNGEVSQYLEAILITEHGRNNEALQGIITRWEVIGLFR